MDALLQAIRLLAEYGHTLWIKPDGEVVDIPTGGPTHYSWIAQNFAELFPGHEYSDNAVFDVPLDEGWMHVRNHSFMIYVDAKPKAYRNPAQRRTLIDIFEDRMMNLTPGEDVAVMMSLLGEGGRQDRTTAPFMKIPRDYEELRDYLSRV
jgi:hypothetical protein